MTDTTRGRAAHIHTRDLAWGPPEPAELGPVHDATREDLLAALALPAAGDVYDLDAGRWHDMPMAGGIHPPFALMRYRSAQGGAVEGDVPSGGRGGFAINSELNTTGHHAGTHIDALCHISAGDDAHWYGGYTPAEHSGDFGARRADASTMPPILARGVLLDVPAHRGVDALDSGSPVDADEVAAIMAAQGTTVRQGDVVLVRTGYMAYWPHDLEGAGRHFSAGITADAAVALADAGAVAIGSDTEGLEVLPEVDPEDVFPVHIALLVERGVHIIELLYLEDLARDRRHEFLFVCLPLRIRGATASMVPSRSRSRSAAAGGALPDLQRQPRERRDARGVALAGLEIVQTHLASRGVRPLQHLRRLVRRGNPQGVHRGGQRLAGRLQHRLLARPAAQERGRPLAGRQGGEGVALERMQHACTGIQEIAERDLPLDVEPDLRAVRDRDTDAVARMGDRQPDLGMADDHRLAVRAAAHRAPRVQADRRRLHVEHDAHRTVREHAPCGELRAVLGASQRRPALALGVVEELGRLAAVGQRRRPPDADA